MTLKEARKKSKLAQFIKERMRTVPGDTAAEFGRIDDRVKVVVLLDGYSVRLPQYGGAEVVRLGLSKPFIGMYSATTGAEAEA